MVVLMMSDEGGWNKEKYTEVLNMPIAKVLRTLQPHANANYTTR